LEVTVVIRGFIVCLATAVGLSACTTGSPTPSPEQPGHDEALPASVERLVEPTPAMLAAALTGNPLEMQAAATLSGCPVASTCPAGFGACTGWSAFSQCSQTCTQSSLCTCPIVPQHPDDPSDPCVPDLSIRRERTTSSAFRICFNAAQQACTEWKLAVSFSCGC
jgi:hypothetical protein